MNLAICEILRNASGRSQSYNLKRVATGLLHIDRAYELTKCLHEGTAIPKELQLAPFLPAHSAFAHRFGLDPTTFPRDDLMTALTPFTYTPVILERQEHLHTIGQELIQESAEAHVKRTFPRLFKSNYRLAVQTFTWERNLAVLGSMFGIEQALVNVIGLRERIPRTAEEMAARIKTLVLSRRTKGPKTDDGSDSSNGCNGSESSNSSNNCEDIKNKSAAVTCLIGACLEHLGKARTQRMISERLLSAYLDPKQLVRSKNPALELSKYLLQEEATTKARSGICFRLLGESGRKSHNSMYVVGVYANRSSTRMLGEGYGASLYLAQQRAALDALRKIQLSTN